MLSHLQTIIGIIFVIFTYSMKLCFHMWSSNETRIELSKQQYNAYKLKKRSGISYGQGSLI